MPVTSYHDLLVWQKAIDLVVDCYRLTSHFPRTETYGLASQLQRAAVSIPSNIAEGAGRGHTREFIRHLGIARGSLFEAETQVIISERLNYATAEVTRPLLAAVAEIGRMLHGLIASLERKLDEGG
ncbi:MAG: four helix bundle protein [Gemmataceae bacterium]|nr:four helix bundle protein [Gemmataceae bacterium]